MLNSSLLLRGRDDTTEVWTCQIHLLERIFSILALSCIHASSPMTYRGHSSCTHQPTGSFTPRLADEQNHAAQLPSEILLFNIMCVLHLSPLLRLMQNFNRRDIDGLVESKRRLLDVL